ncbi:MAG: hypothetical protein FJ125_16150 [Deltaproteobacteria bacterium]|nr:hypothetical protein [Deltaproteobacteria bacterium]
MHTPLEQICPAAQARPHPPQFCGSLAVSAQSSPHCARPAQSCPDSLQPGSCTNDSTSKRGNAV